MNNLLAFGYCELNMVDGATSIHPVQYRLKMCCLDATDLFVVAYHELDRGRYCPAALLVIGLYCVILNTNRMYEMARKAKRVAWTKQSVSKLKAHSKQKTPVVKISKEMKRTAGAVRQKALSLGIAIGHRR